MAEGWAARVTTGRLARLVGALIMAPLGAWIGAMLFEAAVVLLTEPETLADFNVQHGAKPIWLGVMAVVLAPVALPALLAAHLVLATLRLRAVWFYLGIAAAVGLAFSLDLNSGWTSCPPGMHGCPPPPTAAQMQRIVLGNLTMGFAPAIGAAAMFWLILRPDRGVRA
jgi:hypothetical protein